MNRALMQQVHEFSEGVEFKNAGLFTALEPKSPMSMTCSRTMLRSRK